MSDRKMFRWTVQLQNQSGHMSEREVSAFWSPEHELTEQGVMDAARIAANRETGKDHAAISVALVG
jgi:hypothetical protein